MGLWSYLANSSQPEEVRTGVCVGKDVQVTPRTPAASPALFLSHKTSTQEKVCTGSSGKAEIQMDTGAVGPEPDGRDAQVWNDLHKDKIFASQQPGLNPTACSKTMEESFALTLNIQIAQLYSINSFFVFFSFFSFRCYSGTVHP